MITGLKPGANGKTRDREDSRCYFSRLEQYKTEVCPTKSPILLGFLENSTGGPEADRLLKPILQLLMDVLHVLVAILRPLTGVLHLLMEILRMLMGVLQMLMTI